MVEGQAAESVNEETAAGVRQPDFILQQTIFQDTQNPHSHVQLIARHGPQGKHFSLQSNRPIQVQFSEQ